jgi:hypothetical protein
MDLLDKVLLEWSARTDKGYPDLNNEQDLAIFESMFGFKLNEQEENDKQEAKNTKTIEDIVEERTTDSEFINRIVSTFNELPEEEQNNLLDNYLDKFSLKEFLDKNKLADIVKALTPFYHISKKSGSGRGEFIPLLAIKGARSGGTQDKDVLIGDRVLEVKELDASGKFKTAKTGSIRGTDLDANMETLIRIFKNLDLKNLPENLHHLHQEMESVLGYYEKTYKFGSGKPDFFVKDVIGLVKGLKKLQLNPKDYLKLKGKKYFYSKNPDGKITLAGEVGDNEANLAKLVEHPYYLEPKTIIEDFNDVKNRFLDTLNYILLFQFLQPEKHVIFDKEEAKENIYPYDVNQQAIRLGYGRDNRIKLEQLAEDAVDNEN